VGGRGRERTQRQGEEAEARARERRERQAGTIIICAPYDSGILEFARAFP